MINMKMAKLIFSLLFLFSIENLHSINYKELKALSNDSVRNLLTICLDSCHFNSEYYYIIYDIKDKLTKKDFEKKPLTEHEKKRIEFLVSARYEDWELERIVNYKNYKREIDEAIEKDTHFLVIEPAKERLWISKSQNTRRNDKKNTWSVILTLFV